MAESRTRGYRPWEEDDGTTLFATEWPKYKQPMPPLEVLLRAAAWEDFEILTPRSGSVQYRTSLVWMHSDDIGTFVSDEIRLPAAYLRGDSPPFLIYDVREYVHDDEP